MRELVVVSRLRASPEELWAHVTSAAGINAELRPLLRMTFPARSEDLFEGWTPGTQLFRSWILLFGLLPVEYDDVTLVELEPGRRFLERSSLLTQRVWEHERTLERDGEGCCLTDRVRFEPRLAWLGALQGWIFRWVFRLRHRNLRRRFGTLPPAE